jgi:regulator of sigma E protease
MVSGDRVMRIAGTTVNTWTEILELAELHATKGEAVSVEVERTDANGPRRVPPLSVLPAPVMRPVYGIALAPATHVYQASGPVEAVSIGLSSTWKFTRDAWHTLKGIVLGQVSSKVLGGIITISAVSYSWAAVGLAKLFFFLCILSLNLAFLNVLPIPVLDGGHLFFLLIEKIKGSPVSERVLGYSQIVGLVLIVSLMVFVTYNDLMRWVFPSH